MQTVSKEEQKEVNARLKEEQTRKIASLGVQCKHFYNKMKIYHILDDNTIKKMICEQTVSDILVLLENV